MSTTSNLPLQMARVRRHYDHAVATYDEISLLDLASALRLWCDLRPELAKLLPATLSTRAFKNASPAKELLRRIRDWPFVLSLLPGGVLTRAWNGNLMSLPQQGGVWSISGMFKQRADGAAEIASLLLVWGTTAAEEESPGKLHPLPKENVDAVNFLHWLDGEAVRLQYRDAKTGRLTLLRISREELIRRVANSLDASHPAGMPRSDGKAHPADEPLKHLLALKVGGLPFPYFAVLKAAQDLLDWWPKVSSTTST